MVNPMNYFIHLSSTLVGSIIVSSMGHPFGWNWNNGVSEKVVNLIGSVPPSSGLPYPGGSDVSRGFLFLRGTDPPRSYPFPFDGHVSSGLPFPENVNIPRSYHFPAGTYPPSNVWKQGGNYFPRGNTYQGGYSFAPNLYAERYYGSFCLNSHSLYTRIHFPTLSFHFWLCLSYLVHLGLQMTPYNTNLLG